MNYAVHAATTQFVTDKSLTELVWWSVPTTYTRVTRNGCLDDRYWAVFGNSTKPRATILGDTESMARP